MRGLRQLAQRSKDQMGTLFEHLKIRSDIVLWTHPSSQSRCFATGNTSEAIRYARERYVYRQKLSELRKEWIKEAHVKAAARAKEEEELQRRREEKAAKKFSHVSDEKRQARIQQRAKQEEEEREKRVIEKAERLRRQHAREDALMMAQLARRERLLQASSTWIAPEELDERVEEALNNPLPFWKQTA